MRVNSPLRSLSRRYFVVIYWIWTSQVHYDIRYQAEDAFHWIAKSLQIAALIYIGAASGNWNLSLLKRPDLSEVSRKVAAEYGETTLMRIKGDI